MNEEIARLKNDRESTSKEHVAQHPSAIPPPPPAMARPAVLNVEDDFEDGQYAEENYHPNIDRANEGKAIADRMDKLAQEMENIKFQGPKKLNMADFMLYPGVTLPPRFKVPDMDKYDGTGCPKSHLMSVLPLLQQHGLSPEQVALLFPRSLVGTAKKWFLSLKSEEIRTLENIANRFVEQFSMEEGIDTGTQIEDALAKGLRSRIPSDVREGKRPVIAPKEVHNVNYVRPSPGVVTEVRRPPMEQKPPRHFDPLPYSLSVALKKLLKDRKIKLPDIKPPPNPLPRSWREDQFCDYHRNTGHITDRCLALKHQIQNMIDRKELSIELPNVTRNPLPTHAMPPPSSVNVICAEESVIDPASFICAVESEEPYVWKFEEENQWAKSERPYVLSWNDPDVAGPSNQSHVFQCEEEEKNSESLYVLRVSDDEEEEIKTPYILRMEDEDLLLLNDQCDELRHVTRGGRVFKPAELRVENPAEVARGVSVEITPDELVGLVAMTKASKALSFSDEDLPSEGKDHTRPLKITLLCNQKKVSEVLVDNGSALNVCPLSTATTLGFGPEDFIPSEQGILAYDGTRRDVIGTLATEIGPTERPELKAVDGLFGLGYKPTRKEMQEMRAYMFKWAECRRKGLEFPMGPFSMIMNGRFRKEGADCPYYGFSEPWYDESGVKLPGLEIFFADELPVDFFGTVEVGSTSGVDDESVLDGVESKSGDINAACKFFEWIDPPICARGSAVVARVMETQKKLQLEVARLEAEVAVYRGREKLF
ncbi:uncharacterized protein LOC143887978 [Tasmannia lanceolata]|uniref:uncharacterized protein LOC143887978 n=1 Tax=Tasmannia lanceolata TaxID=3420 RepID=UPI00406325E4